MPIRTWRSRRNDRLHREQLVQCCGLTDKKGPEDLIVGFGFSGIYQRSVRCTRKGSVKRKGKLYCHQHDPEGSVMSRRIKDIKTEIERMEEMLDFAKTLNVSKRSRTPVVASIDKELETLRGELKDAEKGRYANYK